MVAARLAIKAPQALAVELETVPADGWTRVAYHEDLDERRLDGPQRGARGTPPPARHRPGASSAPHATRPR